MASNRNGNKARVLEMHKSGMRTGEIAKALGIAHTTVSTHIKRAKVEACQDWLSQGEAPYGIQVTHGTMHMRRNPETGEQEIVQAWPRCRLDSELSVLQGVVDGLCDQVRGKGRAKVRAKVVFLLCWRMGA